VLKRDAGLGFAAMAFHLQRPLPNTMLRIISSGEREDPPPERGQIQPSLPL
jgi:hypothetical protein